MPAIYICSFYNCTHSLIFPPHHRLYFPGLPLQYDSAIPSTSGSLLYFPSSLMIRTRNGGYGLVPPGGSNNLMLLSSSVSTCYGWIIHRPMTNLLGCFKIRACSCQVWWWRIVLSLSLDDETHQACLKEIFSTLITGLKTSLDGQHGIILKCHCHVNT